jgi:hypothetical protein
VSRYLKSANAKRHIRNAAGRAVRAPERLVANLSRGQRVLPDFLIIGAQRSGTGSLYFSLLDHPRVTGPKIKEVHWFDSRNWNKTNRYRSYFPRAQEVTEQGLIVGEATPYYLFHPAVPRRVVDQLPRVKCIAVLRDPVDRAYSHWKHEKTRGVEPLDFREAIEAEAERLASVPSVGSVGVDGDAGLPVAHQRYTYVSRGQYAKQLSRWLTVVPKERMLVLKSEDFFSEPDSVLRIAWQFLGAEPPEQQGAVKHLNQRFASGLSDEMRSWLAPRFEQDSRELHRLVGIDWQQESQR